MIILSSILLPRQFTKYFDELLRKRLTKRPRDNSNSIWRKNSKIYTARGSREFYATLFITASRLQDFVSKEKKPWNMVQNLRSKEREGRGELAFFTR